jgi:trigger factor
MVYKEKSNNTGILMKTNIEDISSVKKKLMIEIEAEEIDKRVNEAYKKFGKVAKIKGFRPGKAPKKILENYFGNDVLEDVTKSIIEETLLEAMEEHKTYPLNMPVIENEILKTGQNYKYSALFEVRPEFELKDYLGIEVEKGKCVVNTEDVDRQLEQIREARGKLRPVEEARGIKEGDVVIIDYEGFDGDKAIEGVKAENYPVKIGDKQFFPGAEEALIGSKKNDNINITIDFKDDYFHSGLAGKRVDFKVKVTDIKEIVLPELDDEFAKTLGGDFDGLEKLREKIKEDLVATEVKRIENELRERLLGKISEGVDFELPGSLVEHEIISAFENIKQNLSRSGSSLEKSGLDEEKLKGEIRPGAEKRVKGMLILGEIAHQNNLTVEDADLEENFKEMSKGMGVDQETMRKYYEAHNLMDGLRQILLKEKTLKYLVENAKVTEIPADKI